MGNNRNSDRLFSWAPKSLWMVMAAMKLKDIYLLLERKDKTNLVKVVQSCPTLCDPMAYTVHGILQARILDWYPFSSGSSQCRN